MTYSKTFTIIVKRPSRIFEKPIEGSSWSDRFAQSIRDRIDTLLIGREGVEIRLDDDSEPLLEKTKGPYVPSHAATSFLKTASAKKMGTYGDKS